jgi:hypothetical protein
MQGRRHGYDSNTVGQAFQPDLCERCQDGKTDLQSVRLESLTYKASGWKA